MTRRSVLFSPGDRPELLRKAVKTAADTVVFDLEDAVAPARKEEARTAVHEVLSDPAFDPDCEVTVRIGELEADLDVLLGGGDGETHLRLDALVVPKVESPTDIHRVADAVSARETSLPVLALIETAEGVLNAPDIARVDVVDALVFGAEDFAASVGATRTQDGAEVSYARQRVLVAARAADVDAIDTLHTDYEDDEGLEADTAMTVQLGYDGKLAIHPRQVDIINEALTPDEGRIAWARRVLEAKVEADAEGRGVFSVDGEMIDAPLIAQAERVVERARAAGLDP